MGLLVPRAELDAACFRAKGAPRLPSGGKAAFQEVLLVGDAPRVSPSPVPPLRPIQHIWMSHRL